MSFTNQHNLNLSNPIDKIKLKQQKRAEFVGNQTFNATVMSTYSMMKINCIWKQPKLPKQINRTMLI